MKYLSILLVAFALTGCYFNENIRTSEVAAKTDGGQILECVNPGIHTDFGLFRELHRVPATALTFVVPDASVATKDTQLVGVEVTVQIKRKTDCASVKNLLTNWATIASDDKILQAVTENIVLQGIKVGVRSFTLDQLLDDRDALAEQIRQNLIVEAAKFSVEVVSVAVKNVKLDPSYELILKEKANLTAQTDAELRRQNLIKQQGSNKQLEQEQNRAVFEKQLATEKAKTDVEVEIAAREGKKTAAANEVYRLNPQAFALEQLRLAKDVFSNKTVYFIPQNMNLLTFLENLLGQPVTTPVPAK